MPELPVGWTVRQSSSRSGRTYTVVTSPDGTRCTWYGDGGEVRLHKPATRIMLGDHDKRESGHRGDSLYVHFMPLPN